MNKALDYNGLLEAHKNKKLLKKHIHFPLWAEIKYDGNYVSVKVENGHVTFITSGNLTYTHTDAHPFSTLSEGVYLAERIHGEGKLGDRVRCNLTGPKNNQKSTGHNYVVHDWLPINDWIEGYTIIDYSSRVLNIPKDHSPAGTMIFSHPELDEFLKTVCNQGYEGLMLKQHDWKWKRTSSRTVELCKYKNRRTADLLCIATTEGEGKYVGKIGALVLQDSVGRIVSVGSGLSDTDRAKAPRTYIDKVIEIEYEQIIDTYIQPAFIQVRSDKDALHID